MEAKYHAALCVLLCAVVVVAGESVYKFPAVILDTPDDSVCPPDSQLESARDNITANISEILAELVDKTYTIPACGGSGWRRVAYLNMTDPEENCPEQWRLYEEDGVRACGRQETDQGSCDSVYFSADNVSYTQVCGRITGYPYESTDGINRDYGGGVTPGNEINEPYLDGVSLTHGNPRKHIWSFFCAHFETRCCDEENFEVIESYGIVGDNYFCDAGSLDSRTLHVDYPVWDGVTQCPNNPNCCAPSSGPWFNTTLTSPSSSDIEVRVCGDERTSNEDSPVELIEIYVN